MVFLGTSAAVPTPERGLSSIAILRGSELILFDVGEGMQRNFIKAGMSMNKKMKIFITHIHADHCVGLLGLLQTMALQGRDKPVDIYGQPRLVEFIKENMRIINFGLTFDIHIHPIDGEGLVVQELDYKVTSCFANHSVPAFSYCLIENDRPAIFNIEVARKMGIPEGNLYSLLQHGQDILHNDRVIKASDIVGPSRQGRKIGISGDTRPTEKLRQFFYDCDILVFESTYGQDNAAKAVESFHSTAAEAAAVAKDAKVRKLFLTHFSARYDKVEILVKEAGLIFDNVEAANDLLATDIPYR